MAKIIQIRSEDSLPKIIARLNQLSTTSVFESTKVIVEQVTENRYEFWITRKGFGVFSDLYDLFGQLTVEENNTVLIQTQTNLSAGIRAILYLVLGISTIGVIDSLIRSNLLMIIFFLFGAGLLLMFWNQSRNRFASEIVRKLTR